jgi:hypothetical protein
VEPLYFTTLDGKLAFRANNSDGHPSTYYIERSAPSKITGLPSELHAAVFVKGSENTATQYADANVYYGSRQANREAIKNRPLRADPIPNSKMKKIADMIEKIENGELSLSKAKEDKDFLDFFCNNKG